MNDVARLAVAAGTGAIAAVAARGAYAALRRYPPAGERTWSRANHRGEPVTLLEGPAVTAGAVAGQLIAAAAAARRAPWPPSASGQAERVPGSGALARLFPGAGPAVRAAARGGVSGLRPGPAARVPAGAAASGSASGLRPAGQGAPGWRGAAGFAGLVPGTRPPAGAACLPRIASRGELAVAVAGLGGAAFGLLDDLRGSAKRRGLRGHLGALAHGEVTTGTVKLAGLAVTGLGAALLEGGDPADIAVNAGLIAGSANLLNLFDLRPGRAIKAGTLGAALIACGGALSRWPAPASPDKSAVDVAGLTPAARPRRGAAALAGVTAVAAPAGAALALLPEDLGERAMLGDAGANALGAMLGAAASRTLPRGARAGLLGGIVALTIASEKVSFTKVIAATPPLNWLDMLGRRPAAPAPLAAPVPGGAVLDGAVPGSGAVSGSGAGAGAFPGVADPAAPGPRGGRLRRHQPGRHRRAAATAGAARSGSWFSVFAKTVTRRQP